MKNTLYMIIAVFTASVAFASVPEGQGLFEQKCGNCHSLARSLRKNKSLSSWKRTAKRMMRVEQVIGSREFHIWINHEY